MTSRAPVDPALVQIFETEVSEAVQTIQADLLQIEQGADGRDELVEEILRLVHDVKGSARVLGFDAVGAVAHSFEDRLLPWRDGVQAGSKDVDRSLRFTDVLRDLALDPDNEALLEAAHILLAEFDQEPGRVAPVVELPVARPREEVQALLRISRGHVDQVWGGASLILSDALSAQARLKDLNKAFARLGAVQLPLDVDREISQARGDLRSALFGLRQVVSMLDEHARNLEEQTRKLSLIPVTALVGQLERVARDAAQTLGRDVRFYVKGRDELLDVHLIESLKAPLTHVIRNAVDHGIEPALEREAKRKERSGTISLSFRQRGDRLEILIEDDGRGIDVATARSKLGPSADGLEDAEVIAAMLRAGISTRDEATLTSGRGIGLGAIAAAVDRLRGQLHVTTEPSLGTAFTLDLPISYSLVKGLVVRDGGLTMVLPLRHVAEHEDPRNDVPTLAEALGQAPAGTPTATLRLRGRDGEALFGVESVGTFEEFVRRPLGRHLGHVPHVEAATILPDGQPALIVDVRELVDAGDACPDSHAPMRRRVLLVDDSPTLRARLEQDLLHAGYDVVVTDDGESASRVLERDEFEAVVSDVQMPNVDGFGVLERFAKKVPIVLMTAFPNPEGEERARRLGALAYVAKDERIGETVVDALTKGCHDHSSSRR